MTEPETTSDIETDDPTGHPVAWDTFDELQQAYLRLQSELKEARETIADVRAANQKIEKARAAWTAEAARLREERDAYMMTEARLRENFDTAFNDWKEAEVEIARLREELDKLNESYDVLVKSEDDLREENERLTLDFNRLLDDKDALSGELLRLREIEKAAKRVLNGRPSAISPIDVFYIPGAHLLALRNALQPQTEKEDK